MRSERFRGVLLSALVMASLMALAIPGLSIIVKRPNGPPFGDFVLKAGENVGTFAWFDELEVVEDIDVVYDPHAQGRKAEVTFGNFEVGAGETAVLDPTETFYAYNPVPDDDPCLYNEDVDYGTAHDSLEGTLLSAVPDYWVGQSFLSPPDKWRIWRMFLYWDTSNLSDDVIITSAKIELRRYSRSGDDNVIVQSGQPDYPHDTLETGDFYYAYYSGNGGTKLMSSWGVSAWDNIELNSTGISWINKTGWTKLCLRSKNDIDNSATGAYMTFYGPDEGDYAARLIITYSGGTLNPPSNLKVEGQISPQYLTTFTPEFSFFYVDNDGDNMQAFQIQVGTSAGDNSMWDNITTQQAENNSIVTKTYAGSALSRGVTYWWRARVQDNNNNWSSWSSNENFRLDGTPPNPPINLLCEGQTNPTQITDLTPEFSAIFTDDTPNDNAENVEIWVGYYGMEWWDSGWIDIATTENNTRCPDITYAGQALFRGVNWFWQIRFMDVAGNVGAWSTETATFKLNVLPTVTNLQVEGQTSPQRLTTFTPEMSLLYVDGDGDNMQAFQIQVGTSAGDNDMWDNTTTENAENNTTVTITYASDNSLSRGVQYWWRVKVKDNTDDWSDWSGNENFRLNQLPLAENQRTEGEVNPTSLTTFTPLLSWDYYDPDEDTQENYHVQVGTSENASDIWDFDNASSDNFVTYAGSELSGSVTYHWRIRVYDGYEWSSWLYGGTFRIAPWTGTAIFSLVNLYTVNVDKDLTLYQGSKLVVKFYTYGDSFENENVIENFSTLPWDVAENELAGNWDEGAKIGVSKARLDLTTGDTGNVIDTIASFTVRKIHLETRFMWIPFYWSQADAAGKVELETEFMGIPFYWSQAPS